jgi:pimeloyl-ACP methyl ester carboxylesterase
MTFVLVHGGGFDSRCWEPLVPLLDGDVLAVDLPGRDGDASVTVDDFAESVVAAIVERDWTDVTLVGHSLAGITLPRVAGRIPQRLHQLVFVSASVPPEGVSVLDVLGSLSPTVSEVAAKIGDAVVDERGVLHPDFAAAMFCNDMDDATKAWTLARMTPEVMGVIATPMTLAGLGTIPRTYVRLLHDESVTLDAQNQMIATLEPCAVVDLDAGHMAMISAPTALASVLNAFGVDS